MRTSYRHLAKNIVEYACTIQPGENVMIDCTGVNDDFLEILIAEIARKGGVPFVQVNSARVQRALLSVTDDNRAKLLASFELPIMQKMHAHIRIAGYDNVFENNGVGADNLKSYATHFLKPVHYEERVKNTKWTLLRWPSPAFAQSAEMSTLEFEELFFKVCTLNYQKMSDAMDPLVALMEKTNNVKIVGNGTNLTFSIKGQKAVKCAGKNNIPDGEVFTAPIKNSVNGEITFNIPSMERGTKFENVHFVVKNGKIISADAGANTNKLNEILDTDEGARFFGEFALGVNPYITKPILDTLFDEKIAGSFHLTPGACYEEAPNGNDSALHWDLVLCQTPECGGGEIWFDDVLVRKNGRFVLEELLPLNPENLV